MYIEGVDRTRSEEFGAGHSFTIDVPRRWLVNAEDADSAFIYMYGHLPDRTVFAHWTDTILPLEPDSMAALRDRLTGHFFAGDSIDRQFQQFDTISFLAVPCLRMSGIWKNDREVIGGPFVNYSFNFRGRFYMLDGLVYDPGKNKLNALTQAEAALRTFIPK
jgi:hypothetical protein